MLTAAQRIKVKKYLGWPAYAVGDSRLEGVLDLVGADVDAQAAVESVLANLASIETEMAALHPIALADKVEESTLNRDRYRDLRVAGRRECQQLAILLNTEIRRDAFSAGWSGGAMRVG